MAIKLFKLNGVPDDEADEVRQLLLDHEIDFYESSAGNWGISAAAIWLRDEQQFQHARALIDDYQESRLVRARSEYAQLKKSGRSRTVFDLIRENPLRFLVYLAFIVMIVYFSTKPFLDIGK